MWLKRTSLVIVLAITPLIATAQEPSEQQGLDIHMSLPCQETLVAENLYRQKDRSLVYEGAVAKDDLRFQLWNEVNGEWFILLKFPTQGVSCLLLAGSKLRLKSTL